MITRRAKTPKQPKTAALYLRISADHKLGTDDEGAGIDRQEKQARLLAEAKGWRIVDVFPDNDKSATNGKVRPEFERMLKAVADGRIDAVVVWHLDRLARKMSDLMRVIEVGGPVKLNISAVNGTSLDLSDPTGIAVAQILVAIAGMEVAHKSSRQVAANAQRASQGRTNHSGRTYGYEVDGTPRQSEAVFVRQCFAEFAAGAPINGLAKMLTANGQVAASGRASKAGWTQVGLRGMLRNRRYLGEIHYHGEHVGDLGEDARLIDADLFDQVQARLADPTRKTTTGPARKYLGSGAYRCGICGRPVISHSATTNAVGGGKRRYRSYQCPGHLSRISEPIDELVKDAVVSRLNAEPLIVGGLTDDRDDQGTRSLHAERKAELANQDRYVLEERAGDKTPRQLTLATRLSAARVDEIDAELAIRSRRSALAEVQNAADPGAHWLGLDIWRQVEALDELCTVTLHKPIRGSKFRPESVQIEWKA